MMRIFFKMGQHCPRTYQPGLSESPVLDLDPESDPQPQPPAQAPLTYLAYLRLRLGDYLSYLLVGYWNYLPHFCGVQVQVDAASLRLESVGFQILYELDPKQPVSQVHDT